MMKKQSRPDLSGITVNGVPLLSVIEELPIPTQESKEIEKTKPHFHPYRKPRRTYVVEQAEKPGPVITPYKEIHMQNKQVLLDKALSPPHPNFRDAVLVLLLSDNSGLTFQDIVQELEEFPDVVLSTNQQYSIRSILGKLKKSLLYSDGTLKITKKGTRAIYYIDGEITFEEALSKAQTRTAKTKAQQQPEEKITEKITANKNMKEMHVPVFASDTANPTIHLVISGSVTIQEMHIYINKM